MSDETPDRDEMFDFLVEEGRRRRDPEDHPAPETLTAYQAGELSPEEDEKIQGHLAACRHCTEMLLELEEFLPPSESSARFEPLMDGAPQGKTSSPRFAYSLAAGLALALVCVSFYAISLRNELSQPVAEIESKALLSIDSQRSPVGRSQPVRLPTTLALHVSSSSSFPEYRVEFRQGDRVIESVEGLHLQEDLAVRILLPKTFLEEGSYQVVLWGLQGESRQELGTYELRIMT